MHSIIAGLHMCDQAMRPLTRDATKKAAYVSPCSNALLIKGDRQRVTTPGTERVPVSTQHCASQCMATRDFDVCYTQALPSASQRLRDMRPW